MESLYLLIPMSLAVIAVIVMILYWAVKSGQFEDLEGPGHAILMDDDVSSGMSWTNHRQLPQLNKKNNLCPHNLTYIKVFLPLIF